MWALKNRTPYAAERNWTRDKDGLHWWIVAVKATFSIAPEGRLVLADEQPPPVLMPEYFREPGQSSLRYDSDLLAVKPGTEVLLDACAHAPRGKPAEMPRRSRYLDELTRSRAHAPTRGFDQDRGGNVMSTATGGYRNFDFLNAVCTPYPPAGGTHR